jgi:hypothetical protein
MLIYLLPESKAFAMSVVVLEIKVCSNNVAFFNYFRLSHTIARVISTTKMRPINKSNLVLVMAHDSPVKVDI